MDNLPDDTEKASERDALTKVPVAQLQKGMYVAELDRPWEDTPFLLQGFEIRHKSQAKKVAEYCQFVYVRQQEKKVASPKPQRQKASRIGAVVTDKVEATLATPAPAVEPTPVPHGSEAVSTQSGSSSDSGQQRPDHQELGQAVRSEGKRAIGGLLHSAQMGQMLGTDAAEQTVTECVDSILADEDAMFWMSSMKRRHRYSAEHCLNVCILAVAFGHHLNFDGQKLYELGMCGLLSDIGKMEVSTAILDKYGALTPEETHAMQNHTVEGHRLLSERGGCPLATEVALNHHERPDGRGYPQGLHSEEISEYAKIISIIGAYDAMTSERSFTSAKSPVEAQKILYENRGTQFDEEYALQFMQAIGPYPPGTWVELHNGMYGLVLAGRRKFRHFPRVILVLDGDKKLTEERIVDLHLTESGELGKDFLVKKTHKDGTHSLRLKDFMTQVESGGELPG